MLESYPNSNSNVLQSTRLTLTPSTDRDNVNVTWNHERAWNTFTTCLKPKHITSLQSTLHIVFLLPPYTMMTRKVVPTTKCRRPSESRCSLRLITFFGMLVVSFVPRCRAAAGASTRHGSGQYSSYVKSRQSERSAPSIFRFRGGSQPPSDEASYYSGYNNDERAIGTQPTDPTQENQDPFQESVQDRVDKWRSSQIEYAASLRDSPRDEQGRFKLLTSVSKGSRALIFFVLMWRDIHLYEIADQSRTGIARLVLVVPLTLLFVANLAGAVASITSPSHSAKRRLKGILNLDKLLEVLLIVFYLIRLTIAPSKYTPREIFISNTLHSVFFIIQSQAFTKLSWDESAGMPVGSDPSNLENVEERPPMRPDDGWAYTQQQQQQQ
jgi:hypothetical protein